MIDIEVRRPFVGHPPIAAEPDLDGRA